MSLASLDVSLTLGLAKFEADSGRAAQIVVRDQDNMARAAKKFEDALIRQANAATRLSPEFKIAEAAALGLGDSSIKLIQSLGASGGAFASVGARGAAAFGAVSSAAASAGDETAKRTALIVASLREAKAKADALSTAAISENTAGTLSDDGLKQKLAGIKATQAAYLELAKSGIAQELAAQKTAQVDRAAAADRAVSAQKVIDAQNGLTATYRTQLLALRELRDAGALTPAQFKQAGTELAAKNPAVQQHQQEVAAQRAATEAFAAAQIAASNNVAVADVASIEKRKTALDSLSTKLENVGAAYRKQLATLQESVTAGKITPAEYQTSKAGLDTQRQADLQSQAAATAAVVAAEQKASAVESQLATSRAADGQAFIASLQRQNFEVGKTREELERLKAVRLGVSGEAAPLFQALGQREFIAGLQEQIALQQKIAAEFGKTESQLLSLKAAEQGLTTETAASIAKLDALKSANVGRATAQTTSAGNEAFIASLEREVTAIGKTRAELIALDAAQRGLSERAAPLVARMAEADANMRKFGIAAAGVGASAKITKYELQTLSYTVSDVVASLASGISPMTILMQQGGQVRDVFGSFGAVFSKVASLFTVARVAIGGVAAGVGALAYAMYQGAQQSKEFADAIVLSGNYAGLTEGKMNSLVTSIAASGQVSVKAAREFSQALISTGEIGPKAFGLAAEAAARYGEATGKSAKDVATEFAALNRDVSAGAAKLNQSLNLLTAAQMQSIRTLQDQGREVEAVAIVMEALNGRLKQLEPNLGSLDRAIRAVTHEWTNLWNAAFDVGRAGTVEGKLKKAQEALQFAQANVAAPPPIDFGGAFAKRHKAELAAAQEGVKDALAAKLAADQAATAQADTAVTSKKGAEAASYYLAQEKGAKALTGQVRELAEEEQKYQALVKAKANDKPGEKPTELPSAELRAATQKRIRDSYAGPKGPSGSRSRVDNEPEQLRKAERDKALEAIEASLQRERADYSFHNAYLNGVYASGTMSLDEYYAERKSAAERDEKAQVDSFARLIAERKKYLEGTKDPSEKVIAKADLDKTQAQADASTLEGQRRITLAVQQEDAARKVLTDRVVEYRAQLLQLEGDETGAADLRAKQAIAAAKLFAEQTKGRPDAITAEQLAREERAINNAKDLADIQRKSGLASGSLQLAEERIAQARATGSLGEYEALRKIGDVRKASIAQLEAIVVAEEAVAASSANPALILNAERARHELEKLKDAIDPLKDKFDNLFKDAGANAIESLITGTKSAKDALRGFGREIFSDMTKTAASDLSEQLFSKGGVLGEAGGMFADLLGGSKKDSPFADLFGGGKKKDPLSIQTTGITASLSAMQTTGINPATSALTRFQLAVDGAAASISGKSGSAQIDASGLFKKYAGTSTDPSAANYENESDKGSPFATLKEPAKQAGNLSTAFGDTRISTEEFSSAVGQAIPLLSNMAGAGSKASAALSLLPSIISMISASTAVSTATSSGSNWFGQLLSLAGSAYSGSSGGGYSYNAGVGTTNAAGISGGRALGGPVSARHTYRVNEKGPEVLRVSGKQYLMMGDRNGSVSPNSDGAGQRPISISQTFVLDQPASKATQSQVATQAMRGAQRALARGNA